MTAPSKTISDVTIYVEEYAQFVANPTQGAEGKWDRLWSQLTPSQRWKLATRAQTIVDEATP